MQFSTIISLAVVASMSVLSAMAAPAPVCNKACPYIYKPICAKLQSGETKTFVNTCEMNVFNCENPSNKYSLVAENACEEMAPTCKKGCTKIYAPVCAKLASGETKTFGNKCTFDVFNCEHPNEKAEFVANNECPATPAPNCPDACPLIYQPVCAKLQSGETKTFGNSCELSIFNCKNPKANANVIAESACDDIVVSPPSCLKPCTKDYRPVCARLPSGETKTFGNPCTLDVYNCENSSAVAVFIANAECSDVTPICKQKKACTKEYKPVCAKFQSGETKTFGNQCTLDIYNCEHPYEQAEFVANAECKN
ncbi:hypothetical protein FBU30_001752 [Linnemannia zychae]|nr:hypothetical protein FBU30_001752 [Linnemannia zychae]